VADDRFALLVVCTGNVCRSPVAERLGVAYLQDVAGSGAPELTIASAGVRAVVGSAIDPASARALEQLGGTAAGFRARQLTEQLAVDADLTLTMTRRHRAEALARAPRAMARTFTLREAAGLLELVDLTDLPDAPQERMRALVARMAAARSRRPSGPDDDVADPIGQDDEVHRRTAHLIAESLFPVLGRLVPAHDDHAVGPAR
jgi:protein-tyrosine phosphatase